MTHNQVIPSNTFVSNSAGAKMSGNENSSLLANSAAAGQQAVFRGLSAQTGKTNSKPFAARSSVVPTIQAILDISWISDPQVWLGQEFTASDWKENEGYNLNCWGDLMEVMEVNSNSSSISPHEQQKLQQQQGPDHLRPAPRGQAPAHASTRSNGQWQSNNAKRSNYNSNQQQKLQQQQGPDHLRPAPRGQAPAHASTRSNGQWQSNDAKRSNYNSNQQQKLQQQQGPDHLRPAPRGQAPAHFSTRSNGQWQSSDAKRSNYNSNQQQQQAWVGPRQARGHSAPRGQAPAGMDGWSVVSRRN